MKQGAVDKADGGGGVVPIRVLHVIDSLQTGGKERQLVELLKGLKSEPSISCEVVTMSERVDFPEVHSFGVPIHVLLRHSRYDPTIFTRLMRIVNTQRSHTVHSWNSMCSIYAAPVARLAGAKFVNGYVRAAASTLGLHDADYFRGKLTLPLSDVIVSNSRAGLVAYGVPARKGVCIYNGIDLARLEQLVPERDMRQALGITTPHIVGMVASFSRFKDYDTYFRAAEEIVRLRDDVTFLAVGDGEYFERYKASVPGHSNIRMLGRRGDVEDIVAILTIGVLTSNPKTHGEGISNSIMEYMALGKPVVATDTGGNPELVEEGRTGRLIAGGDADSLFQRLLELLDNPQLAREFGERGRARIQERFGLPRMCASYVELYQRLVNRGRTL